MVASLCAGISIRAGLMPTQYNLPNQVTTVVLYDAPAAHTMPILVLRC